MACLLLVVPGVIVISALFVAAPACVVERLEADAGLSRSGELTKCQRWRISAIFLIAMLLHWTITIVLALLLDRIGTIPHFAADIAMNAVVMAFWGPGVGMNVTVIGRSPNVCPSDSTDHSIRPHRTVPRPNRTSAPPQPHYPPSSPGAFGRSLATCRQNDLIALGQRPGYSRNRPSCGWRAHYRGTRSARRYLGCWRPAPASHPAASAQIGRAHGDDDKVHAGDVPQVDQPRPDPTRQGDRHADRLQ